MFGCYDSIAVLLALSRALGHARLHWLLSECDARLPSTDHSSEQSLEHVYALVPAFGEYVELL